MIGLLSVAGLAHPASRGYFTETSAHQLWPYPQAIQLHGSDIFRNIGRVSSRAFALVKVFLLHF
jgi:hypothetical protein